MEFGTDELKVLRNAFNSSDFDGDGVLSKQDIRRTSGLETEEEVEGLFMALKGAGDMGQGENSNVITFEEFQKGFIDFPFLLEHFKQEYDDMVDTEIEGSFEHKSSVRANTSEELMNANEVVNNRRPRERSISQTPRFASQFSDACPTEEGEEMIHHNLSKALFCFQKAEKIELNTLDCFLSDNEMDESFEDSEQELLDKLKEASTVLSLKITHAAESQFIPDSSNALFGSILKGVNALIKGATSLAQLSDQQGLELHIKNSIHQEHIDSLRQRLEKTTERNRELTVAIINLEEEQMQIQKERVNVITESQKLQDSLDQVLQQKNQTDASMDDMLEQLKLKEAAFLKEQQESRRLRNLKILNEMSEKMSAPETAEKLREYRQERPISRSLSLKKQVTSIRGLGPKKITRRSSEILDWKKEKAQGELQDMREKLEDQKKVLDEMEEKKDTLESLTQKIEMLEYTNTGLIMQLRRESHKSSLLQEQLESHESSGSDGENENLSQELFAMSRQLTMRSSVDIDENLSNQLFTLTHRITKGFNEPIMELESSSEGSSLETEQTDQSNATPHNANKPIIELESSSSGSSLETEQTEESNVTPHNWEVPKHFSSFPLTLKNEMLSRSSNEMLTPRSKNDMLTPRSISNRLTPKSISNMLTPRSMANDMISASCQTFQFIMQDEETQMSEGEEAQLDIIQKENKKQELKDMMTQLEDQKCALDEMDEQSLDLQLENKKEELKDIMKQLEDQKKALDEMDQYLDLQKENKKKELKDIEQQLEDQKKVLDEKDEYLDLQKEYKKQELKDIEQQLEDKKKVLDEMDEYTLDLQKENKKQDLKNMMTKLEDQKKVLDEMDEQQDTIESVKTKNGMLEYTNTGLIMQLTREKDKYTSLQKQLEVLESSASDGENESLSQELFDMSRRLSTFNSAYVDENLSNKLINLTDRLTKEWKPAGTIVEQKSSSSDSEIEIQEAPLPIYTKESPKPFSANKSMVKNEISLDECKTNDITTILESYPRKLKDEATWMSEMEESQLDVIQKQIAKIENKAPSKKGFCCGLFK